MGSGVLFGSQIADAFNHVADGAQRVDRGIRNLDGKELFDLKGEIDLVEGVDVQFVKGGGRRDGGRRDRLRAGDQIDDGGIDVGHG